MLKHFVTIFVIALSTSGKAQDVIATQGDSYSNSSGKIDFTIGEAIISTVSDANNTLTQGFHQTNWSFAGLEDYSPNYEVSIYPNPTENILNIQSSTFDNVQYTLFDVRGRRVINGIISQEITTIQVNHLLPGTYELVLTNSENIRLKTFKLVKHQ